MAVVAISGASGFVGSALCAHLRASGHDVRRLVRGRATASDTIAWDPATGSLGGTRVDDVEAVVHLAGENIAGGRWSKARKQAIAASRGPATERLCRTLASLPRPPLFLGASAIGIYGDCGDQELDERSANGRDFLADVAAAWESAAAPLRDRGARVAHLRLGMVLGRGGALAKMLPAFRLGLGGRLGSGRQFVSWIALADLLEIVDLLLQRRDLDGVFVCTAPAPITNRDFTRALAATVRRPAFLPVPAFALRLLFGELADAVLLASQRALPRRLLDAGYTFRHPDLPGALRAAMS